MRLKMVHTPLKGGLRLCKRHGKVEIIKFVGTVSEDKLFHVLFVLEKIAKRFLRNIVNKIRLRFPANSI